MVVVSSVWTKHGGRTEVVNGSKGTLKGGGLALLDTLTDTTLSLSITWVTVKKRGKRSGHVKKRKEL